MALHRKMSGMDPARSTTIVHASEVTSAGFCPREYALLDITGKARKGSFLGTSLRYTYDIGRAMERELQNNWAVHLAVGHWACINCGFEFDFGPVPSGPCLECGCQYVQYMESRFVSQVSGISCGIDLLVNLPGESLLRVVEAKSWDKDIWVNQEAPDQEHRLRTNLYLRIIDESGSPYRDKINRQEAIVFYMMKGFGKKDTTIKQHGIRDTAFSPFKEYTVTRNDLHTEKQNVLGIRVKRFREKSIMPLGVCPTATCKRASTCVVKSECFSGKYPADE